MINEIVMVSMVAYVCIDYLNIYINSFIIHSIKELKNIHQPNSTDVIITILDSLG